MDLTTRRVWSVVVLMQLGSSGLRAQDTTRARDKKGKAETPATARQKKAPADSADDPLSDKNVAERKREAEKLKLFASTEVLPFTLIANFKAISKQRDTLSKQRFAGTLIVASDDGTPDTIPVQIRSRGHFRLVKCGFVPLRIDFPKKVTNQTPFDDQKSLKLGAHCQNGNGEFEQVVLREHLAYRIFNLITPASYRSRLSRATYVDSATGKVVDTRYALWFESDADVASRMGGIIRDFRQAMFADVEQDPLLRMTVYQYMISNHDWSMLALHNVRMVQRPDGTLHPVPYDFDFSGLVNARYATPPPQLNLRTVRERLYRGPCVSAEEMDKVLALFRAPKEKILALPASIPDFDTGAARDAQDFLAQFFRTAEKPNDWKAELVSNCNRKGGA